MDEFLIQSFVDEANLRQFSYAELPLSFWALDLVRMPSSNPHSIKAAKQQTLITILNFLINSFVFTSLYDNTGTLDQPISSEQYKSSWTHRAMPHLQG